MEEIRSRIGPDAQIDLIIGGPPCQGFSLTGPRKWDDPRNSLYMSMIRAVEEFSPSAFLIENVRGMAGLYQGKILTDVVEQFDNAGYNVEHRILKEAVLNLTGTPCCRRWDPRLPANAHEAFTGKLADLALVTGRRPHRRPPSQARHTSLRDSTKASSLFHLNSTTATPSLSAIATRYHRA